MARTRTRTLDRDVRVGALRLPIADRQVVAADQLEHERRGLAEPRDRAFLGRGERERRAGPARSARARAPPQPTCARVGKGGEGSAVVSGTTGAMWCPCESLGVLPSRRTSELKRGNPWGTMRFKMAFVRLVFLPFFFWKGDSLNSI